MPGTPPCRVRPLRRAPYMLWREKKPIKKNHIKEFGGRMPRRRPRDKLGTSQGHLGQLGLIYVCKSILKGQNVPGTDGTYHGTDGTCPRDRRDAHQGVSRQNSLCLLVFFFPHMYEPQKGPNSRRLDGPHPQYGWDFPEEIPEKFRKKTPETAGMPQIL